MKSSTNKKKKRSPGEHKMVCDRSGLTYPASEMRKEWNGLWVHKDYFEPRHPQEFVRGVNDDQSVRNARPDGPFDEAQSTTTVAFTTSGRSVTFTTVDLGSILQVSRVDVAVTDSGFDAYKKFLDVEVSEDNATYVDGSADVEPFVKSISGTTTGDL